MSQSGSLVEVLVEQRGTQLVGDHLSAATTLTVQDPTPFDEDGGQVFLDGTAYTYTAVTTAVDATDPSDVNGVLTLSSGLVQAESDLTPVQVWNGSQVLDDLVLLVATGDEGDPPSKVTVRAEQRAFWEGQLGPVDPPVAVVLSDDLTLLEDAPGWTPSINGSQLVGLPDPTEIAVDPPTESPTIISVTGSASALTVYTEPILPTTLLDFYVNGTLVAPNQRSTVVNLTTDGTNPLAVDTTYTVTVQAHNSATDADPTLLPPPSAGLTGALNPGMTATQVYAILAAGVIITGILYFGTNGKLSSDGLTITHPDGRQTILRGDGSGNQFVGQAILDAATILGLLSIQGGATVSSDVTLLKGIADPSSRPGVSGAGWDSVAISNGEIGINPRGLFDNGTTWVYIDSVYTDGNVNSFNKTTGARIVVTNLPSKFNGAGGIVKIGSNWYVLGHDSNRAGNWYVYIFDASWVKTGEWLVQDPGGNSNFADHSCALGIDGAGGLLIARRSTSNAFTINPYTVAGVPTAAPGSYPAWAGADITGVYKLAVDTATVRYVATAAASGIRVFNTATAARVPTEEWTPAAGVLGISHDGTYWHSMGTAYVWKYENLIGTYDFAFTWVDNDPGGAGFAETKRSNILTIAPPKRAKWTVSLPSAPPDDHTTDGANTANLYAAPTGNTLVLQTALAEGVLSQTYTSSTLATVGAAPPSVSGFAGRPGAIGRIVSAELDSNGDPVIDVRGDGYSTLARTINRPVVLRDNLDIDFTGTNDSAAALQAALTAAGAGTPIEYGRQGVIRCDSGFNMLLFQELDMNTSSLGAGGTAPSELRFTNISSSGVGVTGYPGGNNVIKNGIIRGPGTGAGSSTGFLSASGSPRFHAVGFYGWAIGCSLTDAYYAKFFDECDFSRNATGLLNSNCFNQDHFGSKFYSGYGAGDASHGVGIDGGARALALHGGAIENFGASGGIKLYSGQVLDLFGPYFESSVAAGGFGINAGSTDKVTLNLYGCTVYLTELSRWAALSGATNMTINSAGQKFVGPSTSSTTPIAYVFNTTDVGNIKGRIGKDDWTEVAKGAYVPTAILNLGQIPDLEIRHPSRSYLGGDIAGTGSPEGVVPGPIGAIYRRLDGGASTTLYVKTSGTGNTGWTAK